MNARQNPLAKLEAFMQRVIETPFNRLFPSKMEPIEVARQLERAMDDNTMLQGEGRRLSPNVYDIYLSIKDHQQMTPIEGTLQKDWRELGASAFTLAILEELEQKPQQSAAEFRDDLKTLETLWRANLDATKAY